MPQSLASADGAADRTAEILGSQPADRFISSERVLVMNKITITFFASLILLAAGCRWGRIMGNGHIVTDTRSISDFSEIEADGGFQIEWRTGPPSLSITTDENLL